MPGSAILVIDAGTSALRCHLFDGGGSIVSSSSSPWVFAAEPDAPELAKLLDPGSVWRGICDAVERCLQGRPVAAVAITSQRQALAFLDHEGREIYLGPNTDLRAVFEGSELDDKHGPRIYDVTGHLPSFMMAAGKLRWFQIHRPDAYARIATVFSMSDWLAWKLTGSVAAERTLAAESGLLDLRSRDWAAKLYRDLGLAVEPIRLVNAGDVVGEVSAESASRTGLSPGLPIVAAGADTQCGLVGLGVEADGQTGVVAGWSAPVQMVTSSPIISSKGATWTGLYPSSNTWVLESSAGDMGNAYRWLKEATMGGGDEAFGEMDRLAATVPLGSEGARTFLGPGRMDMSRLGMRQGGMLFPVPLGHDGYGDGYGGGFGRPHLIRAALEGFAFSLRANVEQLKELTGQRPMTIGVGGGMTRSSTFVCIVADVLGVPIRLGADTRSTAVGAAMWARLALGEYGSIGEAIKSLEPLSDTIEPDPLSSSEYTDLYGAWLEAGGGLSRMPI